MALGSNERRRAKYVCVFYKLGVEFCHRLNICVVLVERPSSLPVSEGCLVSSPELVNFILS
jgi:hypothetical protein